MDGTLVNTEPYWISAETELIESFGGSWSHDEALQLVGNGLGASAHVLQRKGVLLGEDEIIDTLTTRVMEQLVEFGIPWRPGARELLGELRAAAIPTALVTMSVGRMAHYVADRLGFVGFDAVVSGDVPGIESARSAGAVVIGVPFMVDLGDAPANVFWPTLHGRTVADLAALYSTAAIA